MKRHTLFLILWLISPFAFAQKVDLSQTTSFSLPTLADNSLLEVINFTEDVDAVVFKGSNDVVRVERRAFERLAPSQRDFKIQLAHRKLPPPVGELLPADPITVQIVRNPTILRNQNLLTLQSSQKIKPTGLPFYDAIAIQQLKENDDPQLWDILESYGITETVAAGNDYLKAIPKRSVLVRALQQQNVNPPEAGSQGTFDPFSTTSVADALGKFIAKRFKEELTIAYLNEFRERLKGVRPLGLLLPETNRLLLNTEPYAYTSFLKSLQEAGREDLRQAPENTLLFLENKTTRDAAILKIDANVYLTSVAALHTVKSVYRGDKPALAIGRINTLESVKAIASNDLCTTLQLLALLARNFHRQDGEFISAEEFRPFANEKVIRYFLGILLEKEVEALKAITIKNQPADVWLKSAASVADLPTKPNFRAYLGRIAETSKKLKAAAPSEDLSNFERYYAYLDAALDAIEIGLDMSSFISRDSTISNDFKIPDKVRESYLPLARNVLTLTKAVHEKQYGVALTNALSIAAQQFATAPDDVIGPDTRQEIIKYGTFLVTLTGAQSSDDMVAALETAALPVGSYRIKRNSPFSVSLNAYAGIFGGRERFESVPISDQNIASQYEEVRNGFAWGASAPVGIAFNWGGFDDRESTKLAAKDFSSFSVFLPLIDVGGVFAFRLQDQTSALPELAWKNILAPGIGAIYGFHNSPVALTLFTQYGPQLRKVTVAGNEFQPSAWRIGLSITADIPIFNLFVRKPAR